MQTKQMSFLLLFVISSLNSINATAQIDKFTFSKQIDTSVLNEEQMFAIIDSMGSVIEKKADSINKKRDRENKERIGTRYPEVFDSKIDSSMNDKIVFVDFWFYSCSPCMRELPELKKLYEKYKSNDKFQFISFTFEPETLVKKFIQKNEINYPIYSLSKENCNNLSFNNGYPTHIILNKNRKIEFINDVVTGFGEDPGILYQKTIYPLLDKLLQTTDK